MRRRRAARPSRRSGLLAAAALCDRGVALRQEFETSGRLNLLDEAVRLGKEAVRGTPRDHPDRALHLSSLANSLHTRFEATGCRHDIDEAVRLARAAVSVSAPGDDLCLYLSNLGNALRARFEITGRSSDLEAAVEVGRRAVDDARPDDPRRAMYLFNLALAHRVRFEQSGSTDDLDAAVALGICAVDGTTADDTGLAMRRSTLGGALRQRFERFARVADLEEADRLGRDALTAAVPEDPDRAVYLSNHALTLRTRYERFGDPTDLDQAVILAREAVSAAHDDSLVPIYLSNLGLALRVRHECTGSGSDLDQAIEACSGALRATPTGHPDFAGHSANLSAALKDRYEATGARQDLDQAIRVATQGVTAAGVDGTARAACWNNLGLALCVRYERTGDEADLDDAVRASREAVAALADTSLDYGSTLTGLAVVLRMRFEQGQAWADLDEAIDVGRLAVAHVPPGHPGRPRCLSNLSTALHARFASDRAPGPPSADDLDEVVRLDREAVRCCPADHPDRPMFQHCLGTALQSRFELNDSSADLNEAREAFRAAVRSAGESHPLRPLYLTALSQVTGQHARGQGNASMLEEAIRLATLALALTPLDHPDRTHPLLTLADHLTHRASLTWRPQDTEQALALRREAATTASAPAPLRLRAALEWADGAGRASRVGEALDGYAMAVSMLPVIAWQGLDRDRQEELLATWSPLVSRAVESAVDARRPDRAVELAEQGRSVLWTQILRLRTEPDRLAAVRPDLARRLLEIRDLLDRPGTWSSARRVPSRGDLGAWTLDERRRLAREWDRVVSEVRSLDGFDHFAAAVPFDELCRAADEGPVVIVGAGQYGGYAIILGGESAPVQLMSLDSLTHEVAAQRAEQFLALVGDTPDHGVVGAEPVGGGVPAAGTRSLDPEAVRQGLAEVLWWLWTTAAEPILRAIGTPSPGDRSDQPECPGGLDGQQRLPRMWWCPIGPLALLPLHAAGGYEAGAPHAGAVPDRVVSSYTPTVSALLRARRQHRSVPSHHLMVCLPQTPGLPPLPAARREADAIARRLPSSCQQTRLSGSEATAVAVRNHLPDCSWVHLACHARPAPDHPGDTAFLLWDWTRQPLTVADLVGVISADPDLAFLSACSTSAILPALADEAVTLAAAMQVIGFRHVIATLWPGNDVIGARLAEEVYAGMIDGGRLDGDRAAVALHAAVEAMRRRHPRDPQLWATWVHLGP